jgi:hypothetical protein
MGCLEKWLSSCVGENIGGRVCWMDGEIFTGALFNIDQVCFSKLSFKEAMHIYLSSNNLAVLFYETSWCFFYRET